MPPEFLAAEAGPILLVFARVGAAIMLVPGFGEHHVLPRMRLLLGFGLSLLLAPALGDVLPPVPSSPLPMAALVVRERTIPPQAALERENPELELARHGFRLARAASRSKA